MDAEVPIKWKWDTGLNGKQNRALKPLKYC